MYVSYHNYISDYCVVIKERLLNTPSAIAYNSCLFIPLPYNQSIPFCSPKCKIDLEATKLCASHIIPPHHRGYTTIACLHDVKLCL